MKNVRDSKIRVLLIDDDPDDLELIEEVLLRMNGKGPDFVLKSASSLAVGMKCLTDEEVDVILLDLHLADSKGIDTFLKINRVVPDIPVIILSTTYDDSLALEAVRKGAQDYLFKKEANHEVLVRTIYFAVERQRLRRDLARAHSRLEQISLIDAVTELFNRRGLQEVLLREVQRAQKKHASLLGILVDIDDFKKMNSALGHNAGDVILKEVASKLKTILRVTDYCGRVGGDEFLIILPETHFSEGMRLAEKIRLAIATTFISVSGTEDVRITASLSMINAAMLDLSRSGNALDEVISQTQKLVQRSKAKGKNKLFFEESDAFEKNLAEIPEQLGDYNKYSVMAQALFDLENRAEIGYELLSRSTIRGFEFPDDFFRAALEANMLVKVDYQCFRHCVDTAKTLPAGMQYHFNLFPSTMINLPVDNLLALLEASKKHGDYCIEISEQQIIGDPSYLVESVAALKRAGVSIAIDDLGFGRSCLESLILLEPDIVKIDKKCVTGAGVGEDEAPMKSLKRLIKMARSLGAEIIAEGIETQQDLDLLKELGVKYGQGYFLGRPKAVSHAPKPSTLKVKK